MSAFDTVLRVLNEAHAADPAAVTALIKHRVPCNKALAGHPTIQVGAPRKGCKGCDVGMLGIINGLTEAATGERVAGVWEGHKLIHFQRYVPPAPKRIKKLTEWEEFVRDFKDGFTFWTSEDGMETDIVIPRNLKEEPEDQHNAKLELFRHYSHLKGMDWSRRPSRGFVQWGRMPVEWYDGPRLKGERRGGYGWSFSETPTDFPVWSMSLLPQ